MVLALGKDDLRLSAEALIDRASGCPDFGLAMRDLIEAQRIMDKNGVQPGNRLSQKWEIVYGAVSNRETPDNLPSIPPKCLFGA